MKNRKIELESIVHRVLVKSSLARDDNFILVNMVYDELNPSTGAKTFDYVMRNHKWLSLPSFESVTRARRKLQAEYPQLKGSKQTQVARKKEEHEFIDYSRGHWHDF